MLNELRKDLDVLAQRTSEKEKAQERAYDKLRSDQ